MIVFEVRGKVPAALSRCGLAVAAEEIGNVLRAAERRVSWSVAVVFISTAEMTRLNRTYRKKNGPTDVLSFEAEDAGSWRGRREALGRRAERGDIFICAPFVRAEAARCGVSYAEELIRLVVHGALHLFGYDHERKADERKMFALQERIVSSVCST